MTQAPVLHRSPWRNNTNATEVPVPLLSVPKREQAGSKEMTMPGVDFNVLRNEITMEQVLKQLDFQPTTRSANQLHGPCPVHGSTSKSSRTFSVNLTTGRYYCHLVTTSLLSTLARSSPSETLGFCRNLGLCKTTNCRFEHRPWKPHCFGTVRI